MREVFETLSKRGVLFSVDAMTAMKVVLYEVRPPELWSPIGTAGRQLELEKLKLFWE